MKIARIRSVVLNKALQDKSFFALRMYLDGVQRDNRNGDFIDELIVDEGKEIPKFKLNLFDYCFNEQESERLYALAKELIGKETIDLQVISITFI